MGAVFFAVTRATIFLGVPVEASIVVCVRKESFFGIF